MQIAHLRYFVLTIVLLAGTGLYAVFGEPRGSGTPRWPQASTVYAVDTWSTGPESVEHFSDSGNNIDRVTRMYRNSAGVTATFTILTNQAPKLYGVGAEVPFLGGGYTVSSAPHDVGAGVGALVAQRGTEQWLVVYGYGERRGLLGNGPLPWTLAFIDGITGQPNDYYKLYLFARSDPVDARTSRDVTELAGTLFPRIAAWYAA
jgi:hypothetical protein